MLPLISEEGFFLALDIASNKDYRTVVDFIENQAAIRSVAIPDSQSDLFILLQILWMNKNMRCKGIEPEFHWVAAHTGSHRHRGQRKSGQGSKGSHRAGEESETGGSQGKLTLAKLLTDRQVTRLSRR